MFLPQGSRGGQEQQQSQREKVYIDDDDDHDDNDDNDHDGGGLGGVTDMERAAPTRSIKVGISHSLEEGCIDCPDRLEEGGLKIVDPHRSPQSDQMWMHLNCWEVFNPRIVEVFVGVTNANDALRTIATKIGAGLFQGWHLLDCTQRKQLLCHIFYRRSRFTVTAKDILTHFGNCQSRCTLCLHPNWCSYHRLDCLLPELTPTMCTNNDCDGILHHLCQIDFQSKNNIEVQRQFLCLDCHPEAKAAYLASNRNNQSSSRSRASSSDRPIATGNNVSQQQLQDSQRRPRHQQLGRQEQQLGRQQLAGRQGQQQVSTTRTEQQGEASSRQPSTQSNEQQQRGRSSVRTRSQSRSQSNGAQQRRTTNQPRARSSSRGRNATSTSAVSFCKYCSVRITL